MDAKPHHLGCAVKQLEESCAIYSAAFGLKRRSRAFDITSQHVSVSFLELGDCFYLELIAPLDDQAKLANFVKIGFYHLCFLVDDLVAAREHLIAQRFFELPPFASEAFAGGLCQFFVSPQGHLIELARMSKKDFIDFFSANLADET